MLASIWNPTKTRGTSSGPTDAIPGIWEVRSATRVLKLRCKTTHLKGSQRNRWQGRCVIVEGFGCGGSAFKLNMRAEAVRCELDIAVLDVIDDAFGKI